MGSSDQVNEFSLAWTGMNSCSNLLPIFGLQTSNVAYMSLSAYSPDKQRLLCSYLVNNFEGGALRNQSKVG